MKILIAIASCHSLRHLQDSQRQTWIKDIPKEVDLRYFLGNPNTEDADSDEVFLDVGDGYDYCTAKTIEQSKWVLKNGYDFVYKTDLDTLVVPKNLLANDFYLYDYVGGKNGPVSLGGNGSESTGIFASGGAGYWLSRKSVEIVASLEHPDPPRPEEDVIVAQALKRKGIELHPDPRYKWEPRAVFDGNTISYHLTSTLGYNTTVQTAAGVQREPYTADIMRRAYLEGPAGLSLYNRVPVLSLVGTGRPLRRFR